MEVVLYALEMLEGVRGVLLCMLEGELRLVKVMDLAEECAVCCPICWRPAEVELYLLEAPKVMCCVLLRMLEGGLSSPPIVLVAGMDGIVLASNEQFGHCIIQGLQMVEIEGQASVHKVLSPFSYSCTSLGVPVQRAFKSIRDVPLCSSEAHNDAQPRFPTLLDTRSFGSVVGATHPIDGP